VVRPLLRNALPPTVVRLLPYSRVKVLRFEQDSKAADSLGSSRGRRNGRGRGRGSRMDGEGGERSSSKVSGR